jgi:cell division septation protein DedD
MTYDHREHRRRGGWITTLLALVALVVVGFFCGALAGFLWEEPGLVVAYLSGETERAEWSDTAPVAAEPPPLAETAKPPMAPPPTRVIELEAEPEPVVAKAEPESEAEPAPAPEAKPAPAPVAAAPAGHFAVQVGAFTESGPAEKLADRLRARGYPSYVRTSNEDGSSRWRVRVGPVSARSEAEDLADKLQRNEKLPTWVLDEDRS